MSTYASSSFFDVGRNVFLNDISWKKKRRPTKEDVGHFFGIHPQLWNWPRSLNWSICSPELNWPAKIFYRVFLKLNVTRTSFVSKGDIGGVFGSGPKSNSFESCPIRFFQQKSFENFALIGGKQMKNTFSVLHLWSTKFKKYFYVWNGFKLSTHGTRNKCQC